MPHLFISSEKQKLFLFDRGVCKKVYSISTAKRGLGEKSGSFCTPRGWHRVVDIIGNDLPINTVFKARKPTGQVYSDHLEEAFPGEDWILSRIIRLGGSEKGFNLGGDVDSYSRYIYIHGCAAEHLLGKPASSGCVRLGNYDIVELVSLVSVGSTVYFM